MIFFAGINSEFSNRPYCADVLVQGRSLIENSLVISQVTFQTDPIMPHGCICVFYIYHASGFRNVDFKEGTKHHKKYRKPVNGEKIRSRRPSVCELRVFK